MSRARGSVQRRLAVQTAVLLPLVGCWQQPTPKSPPLGGGPGLVRTLDIELSRFGATPTPSSTAGPPGGELALISGSLEWRGRVEVATIAQSDEATLRAFTVTAQDAAMVRIGEADSPLPDWAALPPVRYRTDERGRVLELVFEEEHDSVFQNLVQTILLDILPAVPEPGVARSSEEVVSLLGRSRVQWQALDSDETRRSLRRARQPALTFSDSSIQQLAERGEVSTSGHVDFVVRDGRVTESKGTEEVRVVVDGQTAYHYRLTVRAEEVETRQDPERVEPGALAEVFDDSVPAGVISASASELESMLRAQVGTYTTKDVLYDAAVFGLVGRTDGWGARFYKAAALAELSADTARALGQRAREPAASFPEVAYLTDVLVAASTPVAQEELLELFRSDKLSKASPLIRGSFHTRLGFVTNPSVPVLV